MNNKIHSPELTVVEIAFGTLALGILLLLFFMGPVAVARRNSLILKENTIDSINKDGISQGTSLDDSSTRSTTAGDGSPTNTSKESNYTESGLDGLSSLQRINSVDSPGRTRSESRSRTKRASEFFRRRFESWSAGSPRVTTSASTVTGTISENEDLEDLSSESPMSATKKLDSGSPDFEERLEFEGRASLSLSAPIDDRLSVFLSGARDDLDYINQKNVFVKKGRLFTLGGKKPMEKPPKVKLRQFYLAGYRLSYVDSYGVRKDFDIRGCEIEIKTVIGTRGVVEGQTLYSILMDCPTNFRSLLLGASTEAYRDEWVTTLRNQQELLAEIEEELSGEEDNYQYKGLPSPAEQALLMAPLHPRLKGVLSDADQAVRKRLYSDNEEVSVITGPRSGRRSIATRPNDEHIQNPLHPSMFENPDTPVSGAGSDASSPRPFSTFSSFEETEALNEEVSGDEDDVWTPSHTIREVCTEEGSQNEDN